MFVAIFLSIAATECSYGAGSVQGVVYIAPHARGHVKKLIGKRFKLIPITAKSTADLQFPDIARGVVIGGEDMNKPQIAQFVQNAYALGLTVAMVDADAGEAEHLRVLVGRAHPILLGDDTTGGTVNVPLVAIREEGGSNCCQTLNRRTHILRTAHKKADRRTADWLKATFQAWPVAAPAISPGNEEDDLTQLANSILTDAVQTDDEGAALQVVNQTWAVRSFTQNDDYYYVQQWVTLANPHREKASSHVYKDITKTSNFLVDPSIFTTPLIVRYAPVTTQNATTYTSGVEYALAGTAGYNKADILSVSGSMKISNSTSTTISPTQIEYSGSPASGLPIWKYTTEQKDKYLDGDTYSYTQNWIWAVPFDAYAAGAENLIYGTLVKGERETVWSYWYDGNEFKKYDLKTIGDFSLITAVPLPFNQTQLAPPTVASVSSPSAKPGDVITVTGTNLYLIEGVIIGGNPVSPSNYEVVESNTTLRIVIPANQPSGQNQSIVIDTQEGFSNANIALSID